MLLSSASESAGMAWALGFSLLLITVGHCQPPRPVRVAVTNKPSLSRWFYDNLRLVQQNSSKVMVVTK